MPLRTGGAGFRDFLDLRLMVKFDGEVQYLVAILPPHIEFLTQLNEFVVYVMVDQGPKAE